MLSKEGGGPAGEVDNPSRLAQIVVLESMASLQTAMAPVLARYQKASTALGAGPGYPTNTLSFFTKEADESVTEEALSASIRATLAQSKDALRGCMIRSVTVVIMRCVRGLACQQLHLHGRTDGRARTFGCLSHELTVRDDTVRGWPIEADCADAIAVSARG